MAEHRHSLSNYRQTARVDGSYHAGDRGLKTHVLVVLRTMIDDER